jgi:hypothetical protein
MPRGGYLENYGNRYNRNNIDKAFSGPFGGVFTGSVNTIKDGLSALGDFTNYIEVECTGLTAENFKEKLRQFKDQILNKIQKHNGITNISMDCLLKNDGDDYDSTRTTPQIVSVAIYNSIKGNWNSGQEKTLKFRKEDQLTQKNGNTLLKNASGRFDNILDETFTWEQLTLFHTRAENDSIRMVISKKGLDDIQKGIIKICDDTITGGRGRHRLSRNYKKTKNRVKSSKKRSHIVKSRRTRRHRK